MHKHKELTLLLAIFLMAGLCGTTRAQSAESDTERVERREKRAGAFVCAGPSRGKRLGVIAVALDPEDVKQDPQLSGIKGVRIEDVARDTPADRAGLKAGDVIVEIDGQPIDSVRALRRKLSQIDYGKPATMRVLRQGASLQLNFTLEKSEGRNFVYSFTSKQGRLGVSVQDLNEQLGQYFGVEKGQGLLVTSVRDNSAAARAGIKAGDCIVEVNGVAVSRTSNLRSELRKVESGDVRITVIRNRQRIDLHPVLEK